MIGINVRDWSRQELRLAFFDFSVRGTGDASMVRAVVNEWGRLRGLSPMEVNYWNDALEWRELGGSLPGWHHPSVQPGLAIRPPATETDLQQFHAWRRFRQLEAVGA